MSTWQSAYVEANGLRLHYMRTGGNQPPLLLTHGFSDDGLCWTPVAEQLAADYDVIMLDARGHGRSAGPEEGYGSVEHATDVAGVITALGLTRPVVLGHSMGAATAIALAGLYPELPSAILLEDPPAWWLDVAPPMLDRRARFGERIVALKRKMREELLADQRIQSPVGRKRSCSRGQTPSCALALTSSTATLPPRWIGRRPCRASPVPPC